MSRLRFSAFAFAVVGLVIGSVANAGAAPRPRAAAGGLIAFGSQRYGKTNNLFTMTAAGTGVKQITFVKKKDGADLREQWSPDGSKLVFEHRNNDGTTRQVWVIDATGAHKRDLVDDPKFLDFAPSYSPDGAYVVFRRCHPNFSACALYRVNADGSHLKAITDFDTTNEVSDGSPKYSPDGKTIAFTSFNRDGDAAATYLVGAKGGAVTILTPPALQGVDPDWSPDGARLVFWSNCCQPGQPAIWSIAANGSNAVQLTHPTAADFDFSPDYSADGRNVAYERDAEDGSSAVYVMKTNGAGAHLVQAGAFLPVYQPAP